MIEVFFLLLISLLSYGQVETEIETPQKGIEIISFSDISKESERINLRIFDFKNMLVPNAEVIKIDSILKSNKRNIIEAKDSIITEIGDVTKRELKILKVDWNGRRSDLKSYQTKLNDRLKDSRKASVPKQLIPKKVFLRLTQLRIY